MATPTDHPVSFASRLALRDTKTPAAVRADGDAVHVDDFDGTAQALDLIDAPVQGDGTTIEVDVVDGHLVYFDADAQ